MSTAAAVLSGYAIDGRTLVIDNNLRTIMIPPSITNLGVETDDDVLRLYFSMPCTCGDTDLTDFKVRINYMNANGDGGKYLVDDVQCDGTNITFSWLVGGDAVAYKGDVAFIVCLRRMDADGNIEKAFHTTLAHLPVLEGLETTDSITQRNPDVIENILLRLDALEENGVPGGTAVIDPSTIIPIVEELPDESGEERVVYLVDDPTDLPENDAAALLITILRNGTYSTDQTANIEALAMLLGVDGVDTPESTTGAVTQITNKLVVTGGVTVEQVGATLKLT